ncbi:hypothetical protein D3C75_1354320 [compost metagenome]
MTVKIYGDLLIGASVKIEHEDSAFQVAQNLAHLILQAGEFLLVDDELFRIGYL